MPMRRGYADKLSLLLVKIWQSMRHNIAMAVENFKDRGYAQFGGLILNRRNVKMRMQK